MNERLIQALYENGDPVSIDAAEELERLAKQEQEQGEPMSKRLDPDDAWNFAKLVWDEMDRKSMPGIYMQLVTESIVKHYTQPQPRKRVLFPTMLRKMWSGGEVQAWLDENVNKESI